MIIPGGPLPAPALLDSGADVNLISAHALRSFAEDVYRSVTLHSAPGCQLRAASGDALSIVGMVSMDAVALFTSGAHKMRFSLPDTHFV